MKKNRLPAHLQLFTQWPWDNSLNVYYWVVVMDGSDSDSQHINTLPLPPDIPLPLGPLLLASLSFINKGLMSNIWRNDAYGMVWIFYNVFWFVSFFLFFLSPYFITLIKMASLFFFVLSICYLLKKNLKKDWLRIKLQRKENMKNTFRKRLKGLQVPQKILIYPTTFFFIFYFLVKES